MLPALKNGDRVMIDMAPGEIKRGDIVLHLNPQNTTQIYLKRVIALPGETIEMRDGKVFINGAGLEEAYLDQTHNRASANYGLKKLEANSYFLMGDNRDNSADSRIWGAVKKEDIKGRYRFTYLEGEER